MTKAHILRAWGAVLLGRTPALSIEVTKECPLRCPGCYAFTDGHLGRDESGLTRNLRQLSDRKGEALVEGIEQLVDRLRPLHVSLVGGDPLVRYRELSAVVPRLLARGIFVQVVTSAFRPPPAEWAQWANFELVVSVDGLQADHDVRRRPATYDRIIANIRNHHVVVHCTITAAMARPGYLEEFVQYWSANANVKKIWCSIFTPQRGADLDEIPNALQRRAIVAELARLRSRYARLDMSRSLIEAFAAPPASPKECIFARMTRTVSADLRTQITPCQFGGDPDCSRCGCMASMGLAAIGNHRLPTGIRVGSILNVSLRMGEAVGRLRNGRAEDSAAA